MRPEPPGGPGLPPGPNGGPQSVWAARHVRRRSEWCWDWYDPWLLSGVLADRGVAVDPWGPDSGDARITRGGTCYAEGSGDLRSD